MEKFEVVLPNNKKIFGASYKKEGTTKNILIQTGMCEHATRYEPFAKMLNEEGYNVYIMDAFGQGLNVSKIEDQEKWHKGAFFDNVDALGLMALRLKKEGKPLALMGHSMGSFMTQCFLERHPGIVDKVIIMSSNGPNAKFTLRAGFIAAKFLVNKKNWDKEGKRIQKIAWGKYLSKIENPKSENDWISANEQNIIDYMADPYCGYPATNGFWHEFLRGLRTLYMRKNLKKIDKNQKILIVAGSDDPVGAWGKGPKALADMYKKLGVKSVELHIYEGMRHEILNEKDCKLVEDDIKLFLA